MARTIKQINESAVRLFLFFAVLAGFVFAWEILTRGILEKINPLSKNIIPAPSVVANTAYQLAVSGNLVGHIVASFKRVLVGYSLAVGIGLPVALFAGVVPMINRQLQPIFRLLRPVPPFAWIPLALMWFGIGDRPAFFIVFIGSFFTIVQYALFGIESIDKTLLDAARNLGGRGIKWMRSVLIPAALPQTFTGLRLGWAFAWMVVVAAELIGSDSGLGFLIMDSRNLGRPDIALVGMICIGIVASVSELFLIGLERWTTKWRE